MGIDPNLGFARAYHNMSVDLSFVSSVYEGGQPGIVTAHFEPNVVSKVDFIFNFNLLNSYVLNFKIATNPFYLTPLWAAFYYTSFFDGLKNPQSEFGAALDFGYFFSIGYIELQYYVNTLVPKISPVDFALGTSLVACPKT